MQSKEYEEWKAHIEAFNVSNVTIREYTQSKGISLSAFKYWKRKIQDETILSKKTVFAEVKLPKLSLSEEIPLKIQKQDSCKNKNIHSNHIHTTQPNKLILRINNYDLEIPDNFNQATLQCVLDCLENRICV